MIGLRPSGTEVAAEARGRGGETPGELEESQERLEVGRVPGQPGFEFSEILAKLT